jgi:DNA-directed RNA polymerase specialized sigma24 family protein
MAITLQQVRNAVRLWRAKIGSWIPLEADEHEQDDEVRDERTPDLGSAFNPADQAEQHEQREQVARAFLQAIKRYPRANIQLQAVWLHIMEDLSYTAIASILNLTIAHTRLLTWRGLRRLSSDSGFQVYAEDEQLLGAQRHTPRARPSVTQERELGNE